MKLPLWVFSYILIESIQLYPAVLSGQGIKRRLGVTNNTASLLKRRLQLFLSDLLPRIKELMKDDILKDFKDVKLPENTDLSDDIAGKSVVHADTVALFSATQRSNGGRKRHKHTGQTASIYLTDEVAKEKDKYQIGTLCHTMGIKQGAVILDSIPDQKEKTVKPLFDFLPKDAPVFTDDGYPWLKRHNQNHKAVNHSARAKDKKRNVWAQDRWSKDGINNQVAEGFQRILKHSFISGYSYISPKYSQLYLNEYSGIKGIRVYGLDILLDSSPNFTDFVNSKKEILDLVPSGNPARLDCYLALRLKDYLYKPPTPEDRKHANHSKSKKRIPKKLKEVLDNNDNFELKQAVWDYLYFWDDAESGRKQKETEYNSIAHSLWGHLMQEDFI